MKPPSRVRAKPDRFSQRKKIDLKKHRKKRLICGSWKRTEQRNLLTGLRKQGKLSGGISYIDFKALKEKIPKRTIQEVESMVEALKSHVITVTVQQLSRQRRAALASRVPIEVWSQLAEDMAGSVVDPVTSAFSQMMFLCSTEPRSLRNSDPPRNDVREVQVPSDARTIPSRPIPMPNPAHVTLPKPPTIQARGQANRRPPRPSPSLPLANPSGEKPTPASSLLSDAPPLVATASSLTNQGATETVSSSGIASTCELPNPPLATSVTATAGTPAEFLPGFPASGYGGLQSNSPASILPVSQAEGFSRDTSSLRSPDQQSSPCLASSSNSDSTSSSNTTSISSSKTSTASSSTSSSSSTTSASINALSTAPSSTTSTSTSSTTPSSFTSSTISTFTIPSSTPSSSNTTATPSSTPSSSNTTTTSSSTSSSSSTTTTSSSTKLGRTSKFAQKDSPRTMGLRCIVDFEKIYSYLSQVHKVTQEHCLTPMESAVVLDLLLSLPEELPLLDCVRLEQHMIQAHASLTSPVDRSEAQSNMAAKEAQHGGGAEPAVVNPPSQNGHLAVGLKETGIVPLPDGQDRDELQPTNQGEAAVGTDTPGNLVVPLSAAQSQRVTSGHEGQANCQSPLSRNASDQSRSSTTCQEKVSKGKAMVCPLNPFMVPLQLLARRQVP